jgi:asparagine synthase (glutamine-hydrolysing)
LIAAGCRFRTESDTEVVLQLLERFGEAGILRLEGMFAFALWDKRRRELILARDWLGQKSLYWTETEEGLFFASEIKALLTLPGVDRKVNLLSLSHYMSLRFLPGDSTFFQGIQKLPAAHVMTVQRGVRSLRELWRPAYEPKHALGEAQISIGSEAAERRARAPDERSPTALSSGSIDSSLVVACESRHGGTADDLRDRRATRLRAGSVGARGRRTLSFAPHGDDRRP